MCLPGNNFFATMLLTLIKWKCFLVCCLVAMQTLQNNNPSLGKKRESDSLLRLTNKALNLLLTQFVYFGTGRNKNRLYVTKWHKQHFYANKQIHFLYPNFKSCKTDFIQSIFHVFDISYFQKQNSYVYTQTYKYFHLQQTIARF